MKLEQSRLRQPILAERTTDLTVSLVKFNVDEGDATGALLNGGQCTITLSARVPIPENDIIAGQKPVVVKFTGGDTAPYVNLFPNDLIGPQGDDGPGTYYTIAYSQLNPVPASWTFQVLSTDGDEQWLSHKTPNPDVFSYPDFLPRTTGTPEAGQIPVFTGDGYATTPADGAVFLVDAAIAGGNAANGYSQSNGTDTAVNTRTAYTAVGDIGLIQAVYANYGGRGQGEYPPVVFEGASITVTAALEYPAGNIVPFRFNGRNSAVLEYYSTVTADPSSLAIPDGETYWVRTFATVGSGSSWNITGWAAGDYTSSGGTDTSNDLTQSGDITGSYDSPFMPVAIRAKNLKSSMLRIAGVGDSITGGVYDSGNELGWFVRAFQNYRYVRLAILGEEVAYGDAGPFRALRMSVAQGANAAFGVYGTNDVIQGTSAADIEAALIALFRQMRAFGIDHCYGATIPPYTTSTDNWATTGNQTVSANESIRVSLNQWLRAGMPVNSSSLAPVAVGTSGALLAGTSGHPVKRVYDLCSVLETTQDSGIWKVTGSANGYTADGIHPSPNGYTVMAAAIDPSVILSDTGCTS